MGNPDNSPPARPKSVPAEARWDPRDPGFEWITGSLDDEGRRHGTYRSWNRDGMLHGECGYDHGKVHGKNINFHPDGTVASEADWVNGVIMDSVFVRCETPTTEPFAQAASERLVGALLHARRQDELHDPLLPARRRGVRARRQARCRLAPRASAPMRAGFPRWTAGSTARSSAARTSRSGAGGGGARAACFATRRCAMRAETPTLVVQYEEDGTPEKKTTRSASGEERDYYFDDGSLATRRRTDASDRETYKGSWLSDGTLDEEKMPRLRGRDDARQRDGAWARRRAPVRSAPRGPALACLLYQRDGKTPRRPASSKGTRSSERGGSSTSGRAVAASSTWHSCRSAAADGRQGMR